MRRVEVAALALAMAAIPAATEAQDPCRVIRSLANADDRKFADLSVGVAGNPYRMSIRVGRSELLPAPEDCDLGANVDAVDISCHWRPGGFAAAIALFDEMFGNFQQCLGGRLTPPGGPVPYGDATALRQSSTDLEGPSGETTIALYLIEAPETPQLAAYHYITLSVSHMPPDPEE